MAIKKSKIPWEYCECGCHGAEVTLGGRSFWLYYDLEAKVSYLREGHGWLAMRVGTFAGGEDYDAYLIETILKPHVAKLEAELKDLKKIVKGR